MYPAFLPRRVARLGLAAVGALALVGLSGSSSHVAAADQGWPAHVSATYQIAFNGFDIGRFTFEAKVRGGRYTAGGDAELSALLGAFKWQGLTRVSGRIDGSTAAPSAYSFDYSANARSGAVKMVFHGGNVTALDVNPPTPPSENRVALERQHLSGVLDPLTAVLALTRPAGGDPCRQKLEIFDGKQRFDLTASALGQRPLVERQRSGQPGVLHVCQLRYRPIAGHDRGPKTDELARTMKIEIALRPIPSANIFVPHEISIPMPVGSATLKLQRIDILTANADQIAFAN